MEESVDTKVMATGPGAARVSQASGREGKLDFAGKRFHFIGAGGIGMSGLAKLLMKNGAIVSGSDETQSGVTDKLRAMGADIKVGHNPANVGGQPEAVVISAAIKENNPELRRARQTGYKVYKYAEMMGALMDCYEGIAVAGTHGKSTTSGWLTFVLQQAGLQPSFIVGAEVVQLGASSGVGNGRYFVAEACEYDRSFLNLHPRIAVILNIEQDHLDYYSDENEIVDAFGEFAAGVGAGGVIIANGLDKNVSKIIARLSKGVRVETFGSGGDFDYSVRDVGQAEGLYEFDVYRRGQRLGLTRISLPGRHNILNALAVVATALNVGVESEQVLELMPEFTGIDRRLMLKAEVGGVTILDDYAHHPTEIKASLQAVRERYKPRRILCVFQPHQYSRTRFLLNDFAESFKLADITIVPDIYFVRDTEAAKGQINSQVLVEKIRGKGCQAVFINSFSGIAEYLKANAEARDLVITMGAGDIWKVADEYIQWLRGHSRS